MMLYNDIILVVFSKKISRQRCCSMQTVPNKNKHKASVLPCSTTGLKFHLRGYHKAIFNSIKNNIKKRSSDTTTEALVMETISETVVNNESQAQVVEGGKKMKMYISSYCKAKTKFSSNDQK